MKILCKKFCPEEFKKVEAQFASDLQANIGWEDEEEEEELEEEEEEDSTWGLLTQGSWDTTGSSWFRKILYRRNA